MPLSMRSMNSKSWPRRSCRSAGKAVFHGIRHAQRLGKIRNANDREHRPENFLLGDDAVPVYVIENGRGTKYPRRSRAARSAFRRAAIALPSSLFDVAQHAIELLFVHQRPQIGFGSNPSPARNSCARATSRRQGPPRSPPRSPGWWPCSAAPSTRMRPPWIRRPAQVRVVQHHDRVLAAHLALALLHRARRLYTRAPTSLIP